MPLPLIPLIIGGTTLATTILGGKKIYDAHQDFSKAKEYNNDAQGIFDRAQTSLDKCRERTNSLLENLGRRKLELNQEALLPFVECFSKIKHVEFSEQDISELVVPGSEAEFLAIQKSVLEISSLATGVATAVSGGILAGFGALGGVGTFGAASTGTAISALSGVAATNATLAWFGGGSLAAGGLGMAGGTVILGGVFAAPILAVGGLLLANKAVEARAEARANLDKARAAAEGMRTAESIATAIFDRSESLYDIIPLVRTALTEATGSLTWIVESGTDYRQYSERMKKEVCRGFALAKTASNLINVPIIDKNGELTQLSLDVYNATRSYLEEIGKVAASKSTASADSDTIRVQNK
jgi:hypothetical protein